MPATISTPLKKNGFVEAARFLGGHLLVPSRPANKFTVV
jgi:hypothetical protein